MGTLAAARPQLVRAVHINRQRAASPHRKAPFVLSLVDAVILAVKRPINQAATCALTETGVDHYAISPNSVRTDRTMLLCFVKAFFGRDFRRVCWLLLRADKTGMGRSWWRARFYQVTNSAASKGARGGRGIVRRPARLWQPISGPGRPGGLGRQPRR